MECGGRSLLLERGRYVTGIRSASVIGIATISQPETSGTYTNATLTDVLFRPRPAVNEPANRVVFSPAPTGTQTYFYPGYNTVSITGSFGFASVPPDIQEVAIAAVTKRFLSKETAAPMVALGPDGGVTVLGDISPANRATLNRYRWPVAR